jgi:hypothetical protein
MTKASTHHTLTHKLDFSTKKKKNEIGNGGREKKGHVREKEEKRGNC